MSRSISEYRTNKRAGGLLGGRAQAITENSLLDPRKLGKTRWREKKKGRSCAEGKEG